LWKTWSQKNELNFHKNNTWRKTKDFINQTEYIMNFFGYSPEMFKNETIIDLGCGSKLRSKFFINSKIVAIDPLANDFINSIEWSNLKDTAKYYSVPAEEVIPELKNTAKFVMCINVLDHTFDPKAILKNSYHYLRNDGEFLLSVDAHKLISPLHPQALNEEILQKLFNQLKFRTIRSYKGLGNIGFSYEGGRLKGVALTYVLKK
jgi:2-polyprenyl-3-methyl-5-hydroxy-6-metoxy-1,4-benzoquinol methylase